MATCKEHSGLQASLDNIQKTTDSLERKVDRALFRIMAAVLASGGALASQLVDAVAPVAADPARVRGPAPIYSVLDESEPDTETATSCGFVP